MDTIIELLKKDIVRLEALQKEIEAISKVINKCECGCGEPLFRHADGSWQCPTCEVF